MGSLYGVDNTGLITTAAGIQLPTSGGTPSTLNYYEDTVSLTFVLSGPWASSRNFPVTFSKIGKIVFANWTDLSPVATTSSSVINSGLTGGSVFIPTRYAPSVERYFCVQVYNGLLSGTVTNGEFAVKHGGNGWFISFTNSGNGGFTNPGFAGILAGQAFWTV